MSYNLEVLFSPAAADLTTAATVYFFIFFLFSLYLYMVDRLSIHAILQQHLLNS